MHAYPDRTVSDLEELDNLPPPLALSTGSTRRKVKPSSRYRGYATTAAEEKGVFADVHLFKFPC